MGSDQDVNRESPDEGKAPECVTWAVSIGGKAVP